MDYKAIGKYSLNKKGANKINKKDNAAMNMKITATTPMLSEAWTSIEGEVKIT